MLEMFAHGMQEKSTQFPEHNPPEITTVMTPMLRHPQARGDLSRRCSQGFHLWL